MTTPGDIQCHVTCAARVASSSVMLLITSLYIGIIPLQVNFLYMLPFIVFTANKCILLKKNRCLFKEMYLPPTFYIHAASVVYQSKDYSFCAVCSATPKCFQMHFMWPHLLPLHCERWTSMKSAFKWNWLISSTNAVITLMLLSCMWSGKDSLAPVEIK